MDNISYADGFYVHHIFLAREYLETDTLNIHTHRVIHKNKQTLSHFLHMSNLPFFLSEYFHYHNYSGASWLQ